MKINSPWKIDETTRELINTQQNKTFEVAEYFVKDSDNMPVCRVQLGLEKNAADLIATAPELLAALEKLVDHVDQTLATNQLPDDKKQFEKALYVAFRTISKARGEK